MGFRRYSSMIPKVIHYCWFGRNPIPDIAEKCILSWKQFCPDYEIKRWDEENFEFSDSDYAFEAYDEKKWAFVSDYARLKIIYEQGGIYLDTDVELLKPLDDLLGQRCYLGSEPGEDNKTGYINTGLGFGAEKGSIIVKKMLDQYHELHFRGKNGIYDKTPCPKRNTAALKTFGYEYSNSIWRNSDVTVFPPEYFSPKNYNTGVIDITANSYSIHHFSSTWISEADQKLGEDVNKIINENSWLVGKVKTHLLLYRDLKSKGQTNSIMRYALSKIRYRISKII